MTKDTTATATKTTTRAGGRARAKKLRTKVELFTHLATATGLPRKQVAALYDVLVGTIRHDLARRGGGVFLLPGVARLRRVRRPATIERQAPNPFRPGEMMTIHAKPARWGVRISPLKKFRESI